MRQVRVGVIGVGRMGRRHCRVYSGMRGASLVGVCDSDAERGQETAREFGVRYYAEVDGLLGNVDAVTLAVPTPLHCELTLACLERGVHVLVEKPIAASVHQADLMAGEAAARGLVLQVGHIERFNPAYIELKNVLSGARVAAMTFRRLSPFQGSNTDVDVVLDLMTHDIDLLLDLVGREPQGVDAYGMADVSGRADHAVALFDYACHPVVTVMASRITEQKIRSIEVTAYDAYVECDLLNKVIEIHRCSSGEYLSHSGHGVKYRQEGVVERVSVPAVEPLYLELESSVRSVAGGLGHTCRRSRAWPPCAWPWTS